MKLMKSPVPSTDYVNCGGTMFLFFLKNELCYKLPKLTALLYFIDINTTNFNKHQLSFYHYTKGKMIKY